MAEQTNGGKTNPWRFAVQVGFYAGLIWGAFHYIVHYLGFTKVSPNFLVKPFVTGRMLNAWQTAVPGWGAFLLMSIFAAFVYTLLFRKLKGPWMGFIYGALWWGLIFLLAGPLLNMTPWLYGISFTTASVELCLYVLWGVFIGYTISYEFTDDSEREPFVREQIQS